MTKYKGHVVELAGLCEHMVEVHDDVACGTTIMMTKIKASLVESSKLMAQI